MKGNIDDLYSEYFQEVFRFLISLSNNFHTAEDLAQETFFRAHLYLENYNGENVKTWLFTVAHNVFIDYYRKQKRVQITKDSFFLSFLDKKRLPEDEVIVFEEVNEIRNFLEGIPEKQKYAVLLHDFHEFSYEEGAQVMNVTLSHFKVLLFRGRQAIRRRREEKHE